MRATRDTFRSFDPLASFYNWWGGRRQALNVGCSGELQASWSELRDALEASAGAYRAKHSRPAVLVDAADYVAKKNPGPVFFNDLQDFAEVCTR